MTFIFSFFIICLKFKNLKHLPGRQMQKTQKKGTIYYDWHENLHAELCNQSGA